VTAQTLSLRSRRALEDKSRASFALANASDENAAAFGSRFGYEDDLREMAVTIAYKKEIDDGFPQPSDSPHLYRHAEEVISSLVADSVIKRVINFGVSYAHVDAIVAAKFPALRVVGVDRSVLTKAYNERHFSRLPNLDLVASDIFDYLRTIGPGDSLLWHMRTGLLLPKPFLSKLYRAAAESGVKHICLFEPIGLSRQTMEPYRFPDSDQPSVALRDGFYIHNYPGILAAAGYRVNRAELIKMAHPHPDVKILSITASRT